MSLCSRCLLRGKSGLISSPLQSLIISLPPFLRVQRSSNSSAACPEEMLLKSDRFMSPGLKKQNKQQQNPSETVVWNSQLPFTLFLNRENQSILVRQFQKNFLAVVNQACQNEIGIWEQTMLSTVAPAAQSSSVYLRLQLPEVRSPPSVGLLAGANLPSHRAVPVAKR